MIGQSGIWKYNHTDFPLQESSQPDDLHYRVVVSEASKDNTPLLREMFDLSEVTESGGVTQYVTHPLDFSGMQRLIDNQKLRVWNLSK